MQEGFFGSFFAGLVAFAIFWLSRVFLWTHVLVWGVAKFGLHLGPFFLKSWEWYTLTALATALLFYLAWKLIARFTPLETIGSVGGYFVGFAVPTAFGAIGALVPIGTWMTYFRIH